MPETAVHKYRELELGKNKVRFAEHPLMSPPAGDFVSLKKLCQRNFRGLVAARADKRHHFRTLGFGENVRHLRVRRNQRPARAAVPFHPARACASGRKARTMRRRFNTILPVRQPRPAAMLRQRNV